MLDEAELSLTNMAHNRDRFAGDENLLVRFFTGTVPDNEATEKEGRPIFKDVPWIEIRIPGERDNVHRPARPADLERFPEHYRRYVARESDEDSIIGTPLAEWPMITRSQAEELRFFNIRTVEQLANVADANVQGMMGINSLKKKAKEFLENAADGAAAKALDDAQKTIADLTARLEALEGKDEAPKRRGRPKKEE